MYFDITYFNEKNEPQSIQLICEKCGEYIEVNYDNEYISMAKSEYCIVTDGSKIICKCGNICQNGLIEPKENQKIVYTQQTSSKSTLPKCPICQSTNLKKISNWSKSASTLVWGVLAAGRVSKTWHCNNCDSEW